VKSPGPLMRYQSTQSAASDGTQLTYGSGMLAQLLILRPACEDSSVPILDDLWYY